MKYLKKFADYSMVNENNNDAEFQKQLDWWNKNYSDKFKFLNDKAGVPDELETTEIPGKNGATYKSSAIVGLDALVSLLQQFPTASLEINAHTSSPAAGQAWGGSNDKLSQARSENMKAYLVKKDPKLANRITCVGKGFAEPLIADDKDKPEAQLQNRRATVKIGKPLEAVDATPVKDNKPNDTLKQFATIIDPVIEDCKKKFANLSKGAEEIKSPTDGVMLNLISFTQRVVSKNPTIAKDIQSKKYTSEQLNDYIATYLK